MNDLYGLHFFVQVDCTMWLHWLVSPGLYSSTLYMLLKCSPSVSLDDSMCVGVWTFGCTEWKFIRLSNLEASLKPNYLNFCRQRETCTPKHFICQIIKPSKSRCKMFLHETSSSKELCSLQRRKANPNLPFVILSSFGFATSFPAEV